MIFGTTSPEYTRSRDRLGTHRWNGAHYYALEMERNIIPRVRTDRPWVLLNVEGCCEDHAIVLVHSNLHPEVYRWLRGFDDLILVCGIPETVPRVADLGEAVYLPLSIDVEEVASYRRPKDRDTCFAGRLTKKGPLPSRVHSVGGVPREEFLSELARFRYAYAVGRTALEAKVLGCEVLPYDKRFPDPDRWKVLDNKDAAVMLQDILDEMDA